MAFEPVAEFPNEVLLQQGGSQGKVKLVNKTPHPLNILSEDGEEILSLEGAQNVPRVKEEHEHLKDFDFEKEGENIPYEVVRYKETEWLPKSERNTFLIVPTIVAFANPSRNDLLVPSQFVRDDEGRIEGCKALADPAFFF